MRVPFDIASRAGLLVLVFAAAAALVVLALAVGSHPLTLAALALAIVVAGIAFGLGAWWFTAQEERRLVGLLRDPDAYTRYRARVPRLVRWH